MYSDKDCVICKKLLPNSHHLKKYCDSCKIKVKKAYEKRKTQIRRIRNEEFDNLPEHIRLNVMMEARKDIMESLNNGTPLHKC